jgi:hypothetical protein
MNEDRKGFVELVAGVLRRPQETFQYVSERDLMRGLLIVFLMVVLAAASASTYMSKIPLEVLVPQLGQAGVDASQLGGSMGLFAGIGVAVSILVGFAVSTLLMHGVATLTGGGGNMKRFFAMHGFAATPHTLNYVLRLADSFVSSSSQLAGYFVANREIDNGVLKAVIGTNLFTVFGLAALVYITYAVAENYTIGRRKAFIIALVPYVLYVAINLFSPTG